MRSRLTSSDLYVPPDSDVNEELVAAVPDDPNKNFDDDESRFQSLQRTPSQPEFSSVLTPIDDDTCESAEDPQAIRQETGMANTARRAPSSSVRSQRMMNPLPRPLENTLQNGLVPRMGSVHSSAPTLLRSSCPTIRPALSARKSTPLSTDASGDPTLLRSLRPTIRPALSARKSTPLSTVASGDPTHSMAVTHAIGPTTVQTPSLSRSTTSKFPPATTTSVPNRTVSTASSSSRLVQTKPPSTTPASVASVDKSSVSLAAVYEGDTDGEQSIWSTTPEEQQQQQQQDENEDTGEEERPNDSNNTAAVGVRIQMRDPEGKSHGNRPMPSVRDPRTRQNVLQQASVELRAGNTQRKGKWDKEKHATEKADAEEMIRLILADPYALVVFTDGSCKPNPGFGGSACCLVRPQHIDQKNPDEADVELETRDKICWFPDRTTNNIAELTAIEMALGELADEEDPRQVWHILTDSRYSIGVLSKNWNAKENRQLIQTIKQLQQQLQQSRGVEIRYHWVPSHVGIEYNERVDVAAKRAAYQSYQNSLGPRTEGRVSSVHATPGSKKRKTAASQVAVPPVPKHHRPLKKK